MKYTYVHGTLISLFCCFTLKSLSPLEAQCLDFALSVGPSWAQAMYTSSSYTQLYSKSAAEPSPEYQIIIRAVLKECNYQHHETIAIKNVPSRLFGIHKIPALVYNQTILIDEDYWRQRPQQELEAVVAHEAMHLVHNDVETRKILMWCVPIAIYIVFYCYQYCIERLMQAITSPLTHDMLDIHMSVVNNPIMKNIIMLIVQRAYYRHQERRADKESGKAAGMISFLENFKKLDSTDQSSWFNNLFAQHPSHQERIDYLKKLS